MCVCLSVSGWGGANPSVPLVLRPFHERNDRSTPATRSTRPVWCLFHSFLLSRERVASGASERVDRVARTTLFLALPFWVNRCVYVCVYISMPVCIHTCTVCTHACAQSFPGFLCDPKQATQAQELCYSILQHAGSQAMVAWPYKQRLIARRRDLKLYRYPKL